MIATVPVYECKECPAKSNSYEAMLAHISDIHQNVIMGDYCQVVHVLPENVKDYLRQNSRK